MIRVLSVFGTRPEAIKMAPVVHALNDNPSIDSKICLTAQHRDMLDQAMHIFQIEADVDLNLMRKGQNLHDLTARMLSGLRPVFIEMKPDVVLVHGDTATTLAATLAAFFLKIPVGHVEAGLRTGNFEAPFPEEANRVLSDRLCRYHFAPTKASADKLLAEGLDPDGIFVTGNTVVDALQWMQSRLKTLPINEHRYKSASELFTTDKDRDMVLITGHRRESFGRGFENICSAIAGLAKRHPEVSWVYPVHLNPNVLGPVTERLSTIQNIHLIPPQEYPDFVRLMNRSKLILTDSGGIQEEAPSLNKPTLVMRDTTERPEGVEAGVVKLVGTNTNKIVESVSALLDNPDEAKAMQQAVNPYGDGRASQRIASILVRGLS